MGQFGKQHIYHRCRTEDAYQLERNNWKRSKKRKLQQGIGRNRGISNLTNPGGIAEFHADNPCPSFNPQISSFSLRSIRTGSSAWVTGLPMTR
jgi:hypothetical protein